MTELTYAIGDIHGRNDLLLDLLERIAEHAGAHPYGLVFLGDYIDRGPDSAGVIQTIRSLQDVASDRVVCLKGNHEAMLVTALEDSNAILWWIKNGGDATLKSFGAETPDDIPADIVQWMKDLPTSHEDSKRYYVHAGFRPGRSFSAQTDMDKIWIREPFLAADYDFGKHVVHGHTPVRTMRPDVRRHRTNLDTAAVFGGVLTAGIFTADQGPAVGFLSSPAEPSGLVQKF
jgi:serine/threonine protein phosphatase 1